MAVVEYVIVHPLLSSSALLFDLANVFIYVKFLLCEVE